MPKLLIEKCDGCGICAQICPQEAITMQDGKPHVNQEFCVACGECVQACPTQALQGKKKTVEV